MSELNPYESPSDVDEQRPSQSTSSDIPGWLRITAFGLVAVPAATILLTSASNVFANVFLSKPSEGRTIFTLDEVVIAFCAFILVLAYQGVYYHRSRPLIGISSIAALITFGSIVGLALNDRQYVSPPVPTGPNTFTVTYMEIEVVEPNVAAIVAVYSGLVAVVYFNLWRRLRAIPTRD